MARDAVAVTDLTANAATNNPAGTAISPANGASIDVGGRTSRIAIRITNTNGSNRVATIKAGVNPPAFRQGLGDLAITVPATTGDVLVVVESARFIQADGTIWIDFAASFAGICSAVRLPIL